MARHIRLIITDSPMLAIRSMVLVSELPDRLERCSAAPAEFEPALPTAEMVAAVILLNPGTAGWTRLGYLRDGVLAQTVLALLQRLVGAICVLIASLALVPRNGVHGA